MNITTEYIALAREMRELGFPQPEKFNYFQYWTLWHDEVFGLAGTKKDGVGFRSIPFCRDLFLFNDQLNQLTYLPTVEDIIKDFNDRFPHNIFITFETGKWQVAREDFWPDIFETAFEHENMNVAACLAWIEAAKLPKE